jgi:hypothetical protein
MMPDTAVILGQAPLRSAWVTIDETIGTGLCRQKQAMLVDFHLRGPTPNTFTEFGISVIKG